MVLPENPGIGLDLDRKALDRFKAWAPRQSSSRLAAQRFARASTQCSSTLTLGSASSSVMFSASWCEMPRSHGAKIMAVAATREM